MSCPENEPAGTYRERVILRRCSAYSRIRGCTSIVLIYHSEGASVCTLLECLGWDLVEGWLVSASKRPTGFSSWAGLVTVVLINATDSLAGEEGNLTWEHILVPSVGIMDEIVSVAWQ